MWENSDYTLQLSSNPFYRHEQIILSAGTAEGYLPMSFLRDSCGLTVHYETSGYLPLSGFQIDRTEDVLYLMDRTVRILHISPDHLLEPERITLRADTVFYSRELDDLRIAFMPRQAAASVFPALPSLPALPGAPASAAFSAFHRELIIFLAQLKQASHDPYQDFLLRLAREIYYMHPDTARLLRVIGLLRRELDALIRPEIT